MLNKNSKIGQNKIRSGQIRNNGQIENDRVWIYGKHPVFMCLLHQKRKIYKILVTKNTFQELEKFIKEKQIKIDKNIIETTSNEEILKLVPEFAVHQGIALKTLPMQIISENEFLSKIENLDKNSLPPLLILDELTDPHNIGAIARSAAAFGVNNIILTQRNSPKDSAIIAKSSSGMIELVNLICAKNLNNLLGSLKNIGYWCIGLDGNTNTKISEVKNYQNIALIAGSEGSGIRHLVKKNCDLLVKIPMSPQVESLNASNAVAIALYELFK